MAAHVLAVLLPLTVAYVAFSNYSFFSWHPFLMSLAFALAMVEAIMVFSKHSSLLTSKSYATRVDVHGYTSFVALTAALVGFWVIYTSKTDKGRPHFTTWHGYIGSIVVAYICCQVPAGIFLKYAPMVMPKTFPVKTVKLAHGVSGCALALLAITAMTLGLQSTWFVTHANYYVWGATCIASVLLAMVIGNHLSTLVTRRLKK